MKNVQIKIVSGRKELKEFIYLPQILHKGHVNWVPPVYREEWHYFDRKKNLAFAYCDTLVLLARVNDRSCGRIMGIINKRFNSEKNETTGRFAFLESIITRSLILSAEFYRTS